MKVKSPLSGAVLLVWLAAGCATKPEPIVFLSASSLPAGVPEPATLARGLSKADEHKIDLVVLGDLMGRHLWDDGNYAALFLQADSEVVTAMLQQFPNHQPPLKPAERLDLRSAKSPLDRDTGLPVMILSVEVNEPNADGSVDATGRWYAGVTEKGSRLYSLKQTGDDWAILSGR